MSEGDGDGRKLRGRLQSGLRREQKTILCSHMLGGLDQDSPFVEEGSANA